MRVAEVAVVARSAHTDAAQSDCRFLLLCGRMGKPRSRVVARRAAASTAAVEEAPPKLPETPIAPPQASPGAKSGGESEKRRVAVTAARTSQGVPTSPIASRHASRSTAPITGPSAVALSFLEAAPRPALGSNAPSLPPARPSASTPAKPTVVQSKPSSEVDQKDDSDFGLSIGDNDSDLDHSLASRKANRPARPSSKDKVSTSPAAALKKRSQPPKESRPSTSSAVRRERVIAGGGAAAPSTAPANTSTQTHDSNKRPSKRGKHDNAGAKVSWMEVHPAGLSGCGLPRLAR